jgi:hypothetical protein
LLFFVWHWWTAGTISKYEKEAAISAAKIEAFNASIAEKELALEQTNAELDKVTREALEKIEQANAKIKSLTGNLVASRRRETDYKLQIAALRGELEGQIKHIPDETDLELAQSTEVLLRQEAPITLPPRTLPFFKLMSDGFLTNRSGAEIVKEALIAKRNYENQIAEYQKVIAEKDRQISNLQAILNEERSKFAALEERLSKMEVKINNQDTLLNEMRARELERVNQVEILNKEINALKSSALLFKITTFGGVAGMIIIAAAAAL